MSSGKDPAIIIIIIQKTAAIRRPPYEQILGESGNEKLPFNRNLWVEGRKTGQKIHCGRDNDRH